MHFISAIDEGGLHFLWKFETLEDFTHELSNLDNSGFIVTGSFHVRD